MFGLKTKTNRVIKHLFYQDGLKLIRLDPSGVACNHKCVMCWLQQLSPQQKSKIAVTYNQNKLSISDYKLLIESAPKSLETVELVGGGEPLLYPEIDQLIQIVKQKKSTVLSLPTALC